MARRKLTFYLNLSPTLICLFSFLLAWTPNQWLLEHKIHIRFLFQIKLNSLEENLAGKPTQT